MRTRTAVTAMVVALAACGAEGDESAVQEVAGPGGVTATATSVAGQLAVSWSADPAGPFKYYVFQSSTGPSGPFTFVTSVLDPSAQPPAPTNYTATGLTGGVEYCYAIESAYPDGTTSELGAAGCGSATGAGDPAPSTLRRRNVPLALSWNNPANAWAATDVGLRSLSTGSNAQGATSLDVPFEVGETIVGAELWRFSDGSGGTKGALLAIAAGSGAPSIIAFGSDAIDSNATARSMYAVPQIGGHTMVPGERLRIMLFALSSPGYTIDSVNLLYTAAP